MKTDNAGVSRKIIVAPGAPKAIGPYSQAVAHGDTIYLSGQIALDPGTAELVPGDCSAQAEQVFRNLAAVAAGAGASLADAVKITIYLTNLGDFPAVNDVMARWFSQPYPARATVGVAALPRGALVEVDAVLVTGR
jgi:reactive intermediate/imine deaminase